MLDDPQRSSLRRIIVRAALLIAPLAALAVAAPRIVSWWQHRGAPPPPAAAFERPATEEEVASAAAAERKLSRLERGWSGATTIVPRDAVADATGERVRWFQGFGLSVESTPPDAEVRVGGEVMGRTPLVSSIDCQPGDPVEVEVRRPELPARKRTIACRKDQLVELSVDLR